MNLELHKKNKEMVGFTEMTLFVQSLLDTVLLRSSPKDTLMKAKTTIKTFLRPITSRYENLDTELTPDLISPPPSAVVIHDYTSTEDQKPKRDLEAKFDVRLDYVETLIIEPKRLSKKNKIRIALISAILYLLQGAVSISLGYTYHGECTLTPVIPWLVFIHGVFSLLTFIFILIVLVRDTKIHQGEIRVLSFIYTIGIVTSIVISIFNDTENPGDNGLLFCRTEISVMLKVNVPCAVLQICLLQFLMV